MLLYTEDAKKDLVIHILQSLPLSLILLFSLTLTLMKCKIAWFSLHQLLQISALVTEKPEIGRIGFIFSSYTLVIFLVLTSVSEREF
jgi:hypothetical protein